MSALRRARPGSAPSSQCNCHGSGHRGFMRVLLTGATGRVGAAVLQELLRRDIAVRVLIRESSSRAELPRSIEIAIGDLLNPLYVEAALKGIDKLFLVNAVAADELT